MDTKKATNKATSSSLLKPDVPIIIDPKCEFGLRDTILSQKGLLKLQETEAYISAHHALLRQDISAYNLLVNTLIAEPGQPPLKKAKFAEGFCHHFGKNFWHTAVVVVAIAIAGK